MLTELYFKCKIVCIVYERSVEIALKMNVSCLIIK